MRYVVHQYASLHDAIQALADDVQMFMIDLDSFEKIYEIEYHSYNELKSLALGHTCVFIGIERFEEMMF